MEGMLARAVQIAINFTPRNQDSAESRKFAKHLFTHESPDRFFANAQFSRAAPYVVGLTFEGCGRIHSSSFTTMRLRLIAIDRVYLLHRLPTREASRFPRKT